MKSNFYPSLAKIFVIALFVLFIGSILISIGSFESFLIFLTLSGVALLSIIIEERRRKKARKKELEEKEEIRKKLELETKEAAAQEKAAKESKKKEIKAKILSNMPYKVKGLITVCNFKGKIVWGEEMSLALDVSDEIMNKSFNDKELLKTIKFLNSILSFIANEKALDLIYGGEEEIKCKIANLFFKITQKEMRAKIPTL